MMCTYCHQTGSRGWRTPELPVDWDTMIRRMDGFGGLYRHTQQTLVKRLVETYSVEAVKKWPAYVPPPAPTGTATQAKITEWDMGIRYRAMVHDIELGPDGLVYAVDMGQNAVVSLDPKTGKRRVYRFPRGARGPHSIELGNDGKMWFTLCSSGQMASFDLKTKKFIITSSAEAPAKRGSYPHTLRINPKDPEGLIWYTDAGRNSCFSLHPKTLKVKEYHLLKKNQAIGAGKGESRGITPYGIDFSPVDGTIWYSKLNGNRIGRIDPRRRTATSRNGTHPSAARGGFMLPRTESCGCRALARVCLANSIQRPRSGRCTISRMRRTRFRMRSMLTRRATSGSAAPTAIHFIGLIRRQKSLSSSACHRA